MPGEDRIYFLETLLFGMKGSDDDRKTFSSSDRSGRAGFDPIEAFKKRKAHRQIKEAIFSLPEIRTDRVAAFQQRIKGAGYHIQGEVLLEKVIRAALLDALF
ncbi:MAG: flagellar biosynthesis anti-sigma factor FlgM [Nitrospirae bacterium]|nr:flagellar biosynthesis anti-sigma factor FlgM [Candidatus Manganitrophaceae bacterium]